MPTTDVMIGAVIVVTAARQVRAAFREQVQSDGPISKRDRAYVAAALPRLVFLVWLYDVTDGAAFSPFASLPGLLGLPDMFGLPGMFGSSVWQPVVTVLGLTEVVGRGCALVVRHGQRRRARPRTR